MAGQMRVGDIGTVIRISVKENGLPFNASSATVKTLKLMKPSGVVVARATTFESNGADGVLRYATVLADLDESGPWTGQVYLELPIGKWHTNPFNFVVGENLSL